jgi:hypothetical protein
MGRSRAYFIRQKQWREVDSILSIALHKKSSMGFRLAVCLSCAMGERINPSSHCTRRTRSREYAMHKFMQRNKQLNGENVPLSRLALWVLTRSPISMLSCELSRWNTRCETSGSTKELFERRITNLSLKCMTVPSHPDNSSMSPILNSAASFSSREGTPSRPTIC